MTAKPPESGNKTDERNEIKGEKLKRLKCSCGHFLGSVSMDIKGKVNLPCHYCGGMTTFKFPQDMTQ